jgi:hypothetical protein
MPNICLALAFLIIGLLYRLCVLRLTNVGLGVSAQIIQYFDNNLAYFFSSTFESSKGECERLVEIGFVTSAMHKQWHLQWSSHRLVHWTFLSTSMRSGLTFFCQWLWLIKSFVFSLAIEIGIEEFNDRIYFQYRNKNNIRGNEIFSQLTFVY